MCVVKGVRPYGQQDACEEKVDIATEQYFLVADILRDALDWNWLPCTYTAMTTPREIVSVNAMYSSTLGFTPVAMFFMEPLESTFDTFLLKCLAKDGSAEVGGEHALCHMMDLFAIIVALHRMGARHNDLMFRNVMVRPTTAGGNLERRLETKYGVLSWPVNSDHEVVLIDFGLTSVSSDSVLRQHNPKETQHIHTHTKRRAQFLSGPCTQESIQKDMENVHLRVEERSTGDDVHPLEMHLPEGMRGLVDLVCVAYSVRSFLRKCDAEMPPLFSKWCNMFLNRVERLLKNQETEQLLEEVVYDLAPPTVEKKRRKRS